MRSADSGTPPDDVALMDGIAARDDAALSALYARHAPSVMGLCLRILRERGAAEEVTGDVFIEIWNRAERYDAARGHPVSYLLGLARSRAIDRLRARARREPPAAERSYRDSGGGVEAGAPEPRSSADPFGDAVTGEMRAHLDRALAALLPGQREALELAYFEGMSHSEVAGALGEPLGTVKTRIRQGLLRLRDSLAAVYGGGALP